VINRILYDPNLDAADFSFVYLDRFDGSVEVNAAAANVNVKGSARMLIKAVPEHRIQQIKYKKRTVWDKEARVDLVFGSTPRPVESVVEVAATSERAVNEDQDISCAEGEIGEDDGEYLLQTIEGEYEEGVSVDAWTVDDEDWSDDAFDLSNGGGYGRGGTSSGSSSGGMTILEVVASYDQWALTQERQRTVAAQQTVLTKVFVDLDGVLVDFDAGVRGMFNGKKAAEVSPKALWSRLASTDRFYERLPWTADGRALWGVLKPLRPTVLTGCPRGKWAEGQKRAWVGRELGLEVEVITCMSKDKHTFCPPVGGSDSGTGDNSGSGDNSSSGSRIGSTTNSRTGGGSSSSGTAGANDSVGAGSAILIDDRATAGPLWEAAGGRFVLHTDTASTLRQLAALIPIDIGDSGDTRGADP
jgi:uncharacterized protein (UPF0248 family)